MLSSLCLQYKYLGITFGFYKILFGKLWSLLRLLKDAGPIRVKNNEISDQKINLQNALKVNLLSILKAKSKTNQFIHILTPTYSHSHTFKLTTVIIISFAHLVIISLASHFHLLIHLLIHGENFF